MYFSQIATAALAFPLLSMAAALPAEKRQIRGNCSGFSKLAVGSISVTNTDSGAGEVWVQIKPESAQSNSDWQTVAKVAEGASFQMIDYLGNGPGLKNVRICRPGIKCIEPAGDGKHWSMEIAPTERYHFELDIGRSDTGNNFYVQCDSRGRVNDFVSTTMKTVTTTTAVATPPPTTTQKSSTITTTSKPTSTKTSTKSQQTTTTSTRRNNH